MQYVNVIAIDLRFMSKLIYKLSNQMRCHKEFRHFREVYKLVKAAKIQTQSLLNDENNISRSIQLEKSKQIEILLQQLLVSLEKLGVDLISNMKRRYLLEFSTLAFASSSRIHFVAKNLLTHFNEQCKLKEIIAQKHAEQLDNATIVIEDNLKETPSVFKVQQGQMEYELNQIESQYEQNKNVIFDASNQGQLKARLPLDTQPQSKPQAKQDIDSIFQPVEKKLKINCQGTAISVKNTAANIDKKKLNYSDMIQDIMQSSVKQVVKNPSALANRGKK